MAKKKENLPVTRNIDGVQTLRFMDVDWPLGPAMVSLSTDRMKAFVVAYTQMCNPFQRGSKKQAALLAGYSFNGDNLSHYGADLLLREDICAAIAEFDDLKFKGELSHKTHRALDAALSNPTSKNHGKAVEMMMARIRPAQSQVHHTHERVEDHDTQSLNILREMKTNGAPREALVYQFGEIGLARYERMLAGEAPSKPAAKRLKKPDVIDVTPTEVPDAGDDNDW